MNQTRVTAVQPRKAVEGGRVSIYGVGFPIDEPRLPEVSIGDHASRIVHASAERIDILVPPGFERGGSFSIRVDGESNDAAILEVGEPIATDLHQVDNPVCDRHGNVYLTFSGRRGQQVPVSVFRVRTDGTREAFSQGIINPTSLAFDADGRLYVSSRFEGTVYRLDESGEAEPFATDLGVACGLAFSDDDVLFVGDRSGTIFKVDIAGRATAFATLPPSVAAFHLALGPDRALYATGPTLSTRDVVYRINDQGEVAPFQESFGRPQGIAFDSGGALLVVEAMAGASGVYRIAKGRERELIVAGVDLVGLAFDRDSLIVCSADTAYRLHYAS